jgi:hypothetical protein
MNLFVPGGFEYMVMYIHETGSKQSLGLHSKHEESHSRYGHCGKKRKI